MFTQKLKIFLILTFSLLVGCSTSTIETSTSSSIVDLDVNPDQDGTTGVRISEINFHAVEGSSEFVELVNLGAVDAQMQGWCIEGIDFCFEELTILSTGEYFVIDESQYKGALSNDSEELRLVDSLGQIIDVLNYDDDTWPELADGNGHSLQRIDFATPNVGAGAWSSGTPSPGYEFLEKMSVVAREVVFSEVHYHPLSDNPSEAFVELVNNTSVSVDLNGWCIQGIQYCWESSAIIEPKSVFVLKPFESAIRLSHSRGLMQLVDDELDVQDIMRYEDSDPWPASADGYGLSLQRLNLKFDGFEPGNWIAGEPTPGVSSAFEGSSVLPIFSKVEFKLSPSAGTPIGVTGRVKDAQSIELGYRIGFGPEEILPVDVAADGSISVSIPGQVAGSLVRFRLIGRGVGGEGTFPRQGDGATYTGTVVAGEPDSPTSLPRLQWFMPDELYDVARLETTLHGDDGFPAVFAYDGEIVDNVTIRIKGNQARSNKKKKWKVMLPAGHTWDMGGLLETEVDEFDLLPAATDKSFAREFLTSDLQRLSGGYRQEVFPVRLERNNLFFGLYMYGESSDADWRDSLGLSKDSLVYKAERVAKLSLGNLDLPKTDFSTFYQRYSPEFLDPEDAILRGFIRTINTLKGEELIDFAFKHIDVPQVVEAIATMRIAQNPEWQHKNYYVVFDPADELWRLIPIDADLNFGRRWSSPCNARCDEVRADPYMSYPDGNRLARIFLKDEVFLGMVDRRTRSLADEFLAPGYVEAKITNLYDIMSADAARDLSQWGQYGDSQTLEEAQEILLTEYFVPKREMYILTDKYLPAPQISNPRIEVSVTKKDPDGTVLSGRLSNSGLEFVDVSLRTFVDINAVLPAGVVIPPLGSIDVVFVKSPRISEGTSRLVVLAERVAGD